MARFALTDEYPLKFGTPWCALPTDEEAAHFSTEDLAKIIQEWNDINEAGKKNPVGAGWNLPTWDEICDNWLKYNIHVLLGGNAAGKTVGCARIVLSTAARLPEAEIACFSSSEETSISDMQKVMYEALPDVLKNMPVKKGITHNLNWSQKNGFTDSVLILPPLPGYRRGSTVRFYNYNQYAQNDQFIEGKRFHLAWFDEKVPLGLLNTVRLGRIGTYHGRILISFTVLDGWNDTIEKIMARTKTLRTRYTDHPKIKAKLPVLQESLSMDSCLIYYAWTQDNPFTDFKEFMRLNSSEPKEVILARGYGVPTKAITSALPLFSKEYAPLGNVVKHEDLPWLKPRKTNARGVEIEYKVTRFMGLDPAGSKNWAMGWVAIDASGTWWIYDEWPNIAMGEWALSGDKAGPAQKGTGRGIKDYVEVMKQVEDGTHIFERVIDPRLGNAEKQGQDGAVTLISDLDANDMIFIPAPAAASEANKGEIEDGLQLINNLLTYDTTKPIDSMNCPKLYVSDRCQNFIYCLSEYSGKLGTHEATKDFVDILRYLRKANCEYVDASAKDNNRTGVY